MKKETPRTVVSNATGETLEFNHAVKCAVKFALERPYYLVNNTRQILESAAWRFGVTVKDIQNLIKERD